MTHHDELTVDSDPLALVCEIGRLRNQLGEVGDVLATAFPQAAHESVAGLARFAVHKADRYKALLLDATNPHLGGKGGTA